MNRRGFLWSILAVATPPAIVRASSLMPSVTALSDYEYFRRCMRLGVPVASGIYVIDRSIFARPDDHLILKQSTVYYTGSLPFLAINEPTARVSIDTVNISCLPRAKSA